MSIMSPAAQDVLCTVFQQELRHGQENWPNGTDPKFFKRDAQKTMAALSAAAERRTVTFSHFLLAGTYGTLAADGDDELRANLVYLTAQLHIWLDALDRRKAQAAA